MRITRKHVKYTSDPDGVNAAIQGILDHLGLRLIREETPGHEFVDKHDRPCRAPGEITYFVEQKKKRKALAHRTRDEE